MKFSACRVATIFLAAVAASLAGTYAEGTSSPVGRDLASLRGGSTYCVHAYSDWKGTCDFACCSYMTRLSQGPTNPSANTDYSNSLCDSLKPACGYFNRFIADGTCLINP